MIPVLMMCETAVDYSQVYDVSSFGLPANTGPGGAGGACTNAMVLSLTKQPECTWIELLQNMRGVLKEKSFTQIPQLSSSRALSLQSNFSVRHPQSNGRTRALYIGINYVGQQGELRGCHNDVAMMKKYVEESHGFDPSNVMVLMDDGQHREPTHSNIMAGFKWLVEGAQVCILPLCDVLFSGFCVHPFLGILCLSSPRLCSCVCTCPSSRPYSS